MQTNPGFDVQNDANAMTNAGTVIERFGGIRPMASKMKVPVTTVQGWKKRNVIPGNRRADVMDAARQYNIDLSDVVANQNTVNTGSVPSSNDFGSSMRSATQEQASNPRSLRAHEEAVALGAGRVVSHEVMMDEIKKAQNAAVTRAVRRSVVASIAVVTLFVVGAAMIAVYAKQQMEQNRVRIAALESDVETIRTTAPEPAAQTIGGINEGGDTWRREMGSKMASLYEKTKTMEDDVRLLKEQAQDYISLDNSSLMDRVEALESKIQALTGGNTDLSMVLGRVQDMQQSLQGQQQLQTAMTELQSLTSGLQGRMDQMDTALQQEQQKDSALSQTLEGVSPQELKAAAMLIGLTQFRESLNRSGPFEDDLALLQTMMGDQDPELNAAVEKLAPYAATGVLSSDGLSNEMKALAGDIVIASIKGEDVSIQDKALARFQQVLSIQKDGQPVMGNDTQATVARAQAMLDAGDVNGAVTELQALQGPPREVAQPLIDQALVTAMAQKTQSMLANHILSHIKGAGTPLTGSGTPVFMQDVQPSAPATEGLPLPSVPEATPESAAPDETPVP